MTANPRSPSRAEQVWQQFIGLFGGDAVSRKFGPTVPPQWQSAIADLSDSHLQRGMRRVVNSGKGHMLTLPEFVRYCRTVGVEPDLGDTAGPAAYALPAPVADPWVREGNQHLLAYLYENPSRFGPERGRLRKVSDVATQVLVRWKNEWVRLMQDSEPDDRADGGKALWLNCMQQAEMEIAKLPRVAA